MTTVLILVVVACGADPGAEPSPTTVAPTTSTTEAPTTTATTPPSDGSSNPNIDIVVPPGEDGEYPSDLMVSCGAGAFPIGALNEIRALAEADPGGVAEAIEPFLSSAEGDFWPQQGWQVLHQTDSEIQLVVKDSGGLAFMSATNDGTGWEWSGGSMSGDECRLEFVVPQELNAVEWRIDPDAAAPAGESAQIEVILNERECVSGQEIGDRLLDPQIVMTDQHVFIAFAAERPPGDAFDCQGNPDMPYTVELPESIGDRELMEGFEIGISLEDYVD